MKNQSEQAVNSSFFQNLDVCCQLIADMIGEKQIAEWTNSDYISLGRQLSRKTKIRLSESTLKRIFGKFKTSERYYPQKATRDALAQFVGYKDWEAFENRDESKPDPDMPKIVIREYIPDLRKKNQTMWLMSSAFLILAFILTLIVLKPADKTEIPIAGIEFSCLNPNGITPHSAIFKLENKESLQDSLRNFSIEFGDGRSGDKRFVSNMLNHYYEVPGRYYPRLLYKNKVVDTAFVYLQTKGWSATGFNQYDTTRVYPVSNTAFFGAKQAVGITAEKAFQAGVDTTRTFFIRFSNVKPSHISGDNFELSMRLNTSSNRTGVRCGQVDVNVYGKMSEHRFSIFKPECIIWTSYRFSENEITGERNDLRFLGHDFSGGGSLKLRVSNKKVQLFIGEKRVYHTSYTNGIGRVMGVSVRFAGIGKFNNFELKDLDTGEQF